MKLEEDAKLVTIYVNSSDQWHGQALYSAIVQLCQDKGIAGATVVRCVEGYGGHHKLRTTRFLSLSENLPVRIEIVDIDERILPLLVDLEKMVGEGLITVQTLHIYKFGSDPKP